ncbi:MAG: LysM peptidoglycan-binding domain-containing protein [Thermodesulfobacteriota bacterium]
MDNVSENTPAQEPVPATDFKQRFKLSGLEILFGILILLGLIYVGYFILFQDSSGMGSKLQKKISSMETSSREQVEKLDKKIKAIQDTEVQLESRLKSLEALTQNLSTKIGKLEKRPAEGNKPVPGKEKINYKVKKGETLQGIARKFKVSVDDLARLNKLDKNRPVRAGDTLVISPR